MESLLRWSVEHSSPDHPPPRDIRQLDPGIIEAILGKPDAQKMKEELAVASNPDASEDDRVTALDNFEMLIENIDNANDITNMKMWPSLLGLLDSPLDSIRLNTLWILGTAVQNNEKAQRAFMEHSPLPLILRTLQPDSIDPSGATRSKAIYCLSSALRHNRPAVEQLGKESGWEILKSSLSDSDPSVRRKVAFLFNSLLLPDGTPPNQPANTTTSDITLDALNKHGVIASLISSLAQPQPLGPDGDDETIDHDFVEKAARTLFTYLENGGTTAAQDLLTLRQAMEAAEREKLDWGLTSGEWRSLRDKCQ